MARVYYLFCLYDFFVIKTNYYDIFYPAASKCKPNMKAAPPAIGFKAENTPPPLRARGRPAGYPSKNITPLPTTGERPRQGAG